MIAVSASWMFPYHSGCRQNDLLFRTGRPMIASSMPFATEAGALGLKYR